MVDEVIVIGLVLVCESYLCGDVIFDVVCCIGVQVIYFGYGFLFENVDFVQVCVEVGIVFIGFFVVVICVMGDKSVVKVLMQQVGVLFILGYYGDDQVLEFLCGQVDGIGYLVLIKVSVGGGGKGMCCVDNSVVFVELLVSCQCEVQLVFGNVYVLVEKYVE